MVDRSGWGARLSGPSRHDPAFGSGPGVDLYLDQQKHRHHGRPAGRLLFQNNGRIRPIFERSMIRSRVNAGLAGAPEHTGKRLLGPPSK